MHSFQFENIQWMKSYKPKNAFGAETTGTDVAAHLFKLLVLYGKICRIRVDFIDVELINVELLCRPSNKPRFQSISVTNNISLLC